MAIAPALAEQLSLLPPRPLRACRGRTRRCARLSTLCSGGPGGGPRHLRLRVARAALAARDVQRLVSRHRRVPAVGFLRPARRRPRRVVARVPGVSEGRSKDSPEARQERRRRFARAPASAVERVEEAGLPALGRFGEAVQLRRDAGRALLDGHAEAQRLLLPERDAHVPAAEPALEVAPDVCVVAPDDPHDEVCRRNPVRALRRVEPADRLQRRVDVTRAAPRRIRVRKVVVTDLAATR